MTGTKRIIWIDYARLIGIFLVVLGHTSIPRPLVDFIYSFHMPLFFFISGLLFQPDKFSSVKMFALHRFKQIMLPYFVFTVLTYLFWLFAGRHFGKTPETEISVFTPLVGALYGVDSGYFLVHCGSLWFLPCLFIVEILYFLVRKLARPFIIMVVFSVIGYLNLLLEHIAFPWSFDTAIIAIVFYAAGYAIASSGILTSGIKKQYIVFIIPVMTILLYFLSSTFGRMDMASNIYSNFAAFLLMGFMGIGLTVCFSFLFSDLAGESRGVVFYAANTLIILSFHEIAGSLVKAVSFFVFKLPLEIFSNDLPRNLILTICSFIVLIPLIWILPKLLPFLSRSRTVHKVALSGDSLQS